MAQHAANDKAAFPAPPAPFYKYTDRDSSPNVAAAASRRARTEEIAPRPHTFGHAVAVEPLLLAHRYQRRRARRTGQP